MSSARCSPPWRFSGRSARPRIRPGRRSLELPVRIGIHSGPGRVRPSRRQFVDGPYGYRRHRQCRGPAPASRRAGDDSAERRDLRLAQSYARVEPVGPLVLKGKADPITAFRLLGVSHRARLRRRGVARARTVFVDRETDLAVLNDFLRQVENGRGQAVGLVGEPGIGKSRLLAEFRRQLGDGRATWVEGRCLSYGTAIPYMLVLDMLRSNCGIAETDPPEVIAEKVRAGLREVGMDPDEGGRGAAAPAGHQGYRRASPALANPEAVKNKAFEISPPALPQGQSAAGR